MRPYNNQLFIDLTCFVCTSFLVKFWNSTFEQNFLNFLQDSPWWALKILVQLYFPELHLSSPTFTIIKLFFNHCLFLGIKQVHGYPIWVIGIVVLIVAGILISLASVFLRPNVIHVSTQESTVQNVWIILYIPPDELVELKQV